LLSNCLKNAAAQSCLKTTIAHSYIKNAVAQSCLKNAVVKSRSSCSKSLKFAQSCSNLHK
jgi:hypothetical protein